MHFVQNPPDAAALMTTARSFGNYDLPSALADLIDNSIKAESHNIRLSCLYNGGDPQVSVVDDGYGMTASELRLAMRPASANPTADRSPDDLGRFGWGLKSASFSQCKKLTVITRKNGVLPGAEWNLDDVENWKMGVIAEGESKAICAPELRERTGTEILWSHCDRLSENGTITEDEFNDLVVYTRKRISLIYHKYLTGMVRRRSLTITLNGQNIEGFDPFYRHHDATQQLEREEVKIGGRRIHINPIYFPITPRSRFRNMTAWEAKKVFSEIKDSTYTEMTG